MSISRTDVLHVAKLARLELTEDEVTTMVQDLGSILDHMAELSTLDTREIPPTTWLAVDRAPLRPDALAEGVPAAPALAEAPRAAAEGFAVPAFVDEG
jgi:aspartyl-tRNA(Asn)/glutamyl-tRNA(Gln) amidotransferase subunit C